MKRRVASWSVFLFSITSFGANYDLISKARCELKGGKLQACRFGPHEGKASGLEKTSLPLKTVVRVVSSDDCSSPFPLKVKIRSISSKEEFEMPALGKETKEFALKGNGPFGEHVIEDGTAKWTKLAVFDPACTSELKVDLDIPNVKDRDEAEAICEKKVEEIEEGKAHGELLQELITLREGFKYLSSVAELLKVKLDQKGLSTLTADPKSTADVLKKIRNSQGVKLKPAEKEALDSLLDLVEELSQEKEAPKRTLEDLLGATNSKIINDLATKAKSSAEATEKLKANHRKLAALCQELRTMGAQLHSWIPKKDFKEFLSKVESCDEG